MEVDAHCLSQTTVLFCIQPWIFKQTWMFKVQIANQKKLHGLALGPSTYTCLDLAKYIPKKRKKKDSVLHTPHWKSPDCHGPDHPSYKKRAL